MSKPLATVVALIVAGTALAAQDDPLKTARDLYASAAYDEALAELTHAAGSAPAPATEVETDAYRAFCLVALGRTADALTIAESLLRKDPMFSINRYRDASPRIAAVFETARSHVLPQLIRDEYRTARTLAADKAPEAPARLAHVRELLDEARTVGVMDETLQDLRLLVEGFLELSEETESAASASAAPAAPIGARPGAAAPVVPAAARMTVKEGDAGVIPAIVVSQTLPRVPSDLFELMKRLRRTAAIDVVINEGGTVEDVIVRESVNAAYDSLLVAAARTWRYRPALKDGVAVRFVKTVAVNVQAP
jgi:TonB family protein